MNTSLPSIREELQSLSATYNEGKLYRLGVKTIIVGKPNVGKSSLLNALLGEVRALVTPVPGTTRDFIQETISVQGIPLVLQDTAGLHAGNDEIEKLGMALTRARLSEAELVLFIIDASRQLDERDQAIINELSNRQVIAVSIRKIFLRQSVRSRFKSFCPVPRCQYQPAAAAVLTNCRNLSIRPCFRSPTAVQQTVSSPMPGSRMPW